MFRWLIPAFAFLLPFEQLWNELFKSATEFKPYRLVGLTLIALRLLVAIATRRGIRVDFFDRAYLFLLGWAMAIALFWYMVAGDGNLTWAISNTAIILFGLLTCIVIKNEASAPQEAQRAATAFVYGTGASIVVYIGLGHELTRTRFAGFYDNPNRLAVAIGLSLCVLFARILFAKRRAAVMRYMFDVVLVLFFTIVLMFTASRSAILSAVVAIALFAIPLAIKMRRNRQTVVRLFALIPIVLILAGGLTLAFDTFRSESLALQRYEFGFTRGSQARVDLWRSAWNVAEDHYFIGAGQGQYRYYHRASIRRLDEVSSSKLVQHDLVVHNDYMDVLTSFGFHCLLLYLWMIVLMYRGLMRRIAVEGVAPAASVTAAYLPLLAFLLVNSTTHLMLSSPDYWLFIGLITSHVVVRAPQRKLR